MTRLDSLLENRVKKVAGLNSPNNFSGYNDKHNKSKKKKVDPKDFRKRLLDSLDRERKR